MENLLTEIDKELGRYKEAGKSMCMTSSFQTHSLPLLHLMTQIYPELPILFIDTGFHFPETYQFRDEIWRAWNLNLINLKSSIPKNQQKDSEGRFLYTADPEYCCFINKVKPLQEEINKYAVWIAGLRKGQTTFRQGLSKEEIQQNGQIKYHPILEWTSKMIHDYRINHHLPEHPLDKKGYVSIGCQPCTTLPAKQAERQGRWFGLHKTECGIHLQKD